jgi:hypothetical protein
MSKSKPKVTVMPFRLSVQDASGKHLYWADEEEARQLIKERKVRILRTKKRIRGLRAVGSIVASQATLRGKGYSHDHETNTNPKGVWTLVRIPESTRDIFTSVIDDLCSRKAA